MIQKFVQAWDANKDQLQAWFEDADNSNYLSYKQLVEAVVEQVINPFLDDYSKYDVSKIHIIDDGDYQGTQVFIIPRDTYQPGPDDYIVTNQYYGSCSGCDTLLAILDEPKDTRIKSLMTLSLHIVQRFKPLFDNDK